MDPVVVDNVVVLNNECPFSEPFRFEISFSCRQPLQEDVEWKVIYVGSAENPAHDQELDSVLVGPVALGENKFTFEVPAPDPARIPRNELVGVTVLLVTCSYRDKEFARVGYYVNNDYATPELRENPPNPPDVSQLTRNILVSKPHVTTFPIVWDAVAPEPNNNSMSNEGFLTMEGVAVGEMSSQGPTYAGDAGTTGAGVAVGDWNAQTGVGGNNGGVSVGEMETF